MQYISNELTHFVGYMEREWRVAGKVRFSISDLQRVFVSSEFEDQVRRDLPELANRVVTLSP
jgi:hypothetical protein